MAVFVHLDGYQRHIGMEELASYIADCTITVTAMTEAQGEFGVITASGTRLGNIVANHHSDAWNLLLDAANRHKGR